MLICSAIFFFITPGRKKCPQVRDADESGCTVEVYGELLKNIDMHLFVARAMHGGTSMISKVNHPNVPDYDSYKPTASIMYINMTNLYIGKNCNITT